MDATSSDDPSRHDRRFLRFRSDGALIHHRGLDGLRGLAVAAVVIFHADLGIMPGGYLGVSLFFTLSGFLITSLALTEVDRHGRFGLRAFWSRRFRRLLPAAWFTIGAVLVIASVAGSISIGLRGDAWASLANLANWRFLATGQSYGNLFSTESPLLHFWSLAIEEQFYLAFPFIVWAVVSLSSRPARLLGVVVGMIAAVSFALPLTVVHGLDRVYYGTDTRAGEIALGALCAAVLSSRSVRQALISPAAKRLLGVLGTVVGLVVLAAWIGVTRTWWGITNGGLILVAMSSVVLVVSAMVPSGPFHRFVTWWPLGVLGRISFAVYLFHWPALTYLTPERTGIPDPLRVVVVIAGVIVAALLSERALEKPFRRGSIAPRWMGAVGVAALAVLVALPMLVPEPASLVTVATLEEEAEAYRESQLGVVAPAPPVVEGVSVESVPRPDVAMFGDSILLTMALASGYYNADWRYMGPGDGVLELGCGVVRGGRRRTDVDVRAQDTCDSWPETWTRSVEQNDPDAAVVMSCQWENVDRRYEGGEWVHVGDPNFDDLVRAEYTTAIDVLHSAGVPLVLWVRCPYFSQSVGVDELGEGFRESREPARTDRLNSIIDEVAAARSDVEVLDLATWVNERVDDATIRPDGSHFERTVDTGAGEVFTRLVLDAYESWWTENRSGG